MKILFIKLRHIGDSLLLTPTLVATKARFPGAEIWVLVRKSCDGILAGCPEIDRILTTANPDTAKRSMGDWVEDLRTAVVLRRESFDHVFELTDNDRGRFFAIAARTRHRCTNQHRTLKPVWRPFFHRICTIKRYPKHQVVRDYTCPREVLELPEAPGPLRFCESADLPWEGLGDERDFAVFHIHTRWARKSWPIERWEEVIGGVLEMVPRVVISCGPGDEEVASARGLMEKFGPRVDATLGRANWSQLAWLLRRARFFVGVDTAAMHLAAACQCPTVALFGPSPVFEYHPWQVRHWMVRPQDWLPEEEVANIHRDDLMRQIASGRVLRASRSAAGSA